MANNRQQRQNLQKRNRRVIRLKASKGGRAKTMKAGTKFERVVERVTAPGYLYGGTTQFTPHPERSLKGTNATIRAKK